MEVRTRSVEIAGIRIDPDGEWMKQVARNLTDNIDAFLINAKYFIHFGERHPHHLIKEYVAHDHGERYHQGLDGQLIRPVTAANDTPVDGPIRCRQRLGGVLSYYREAA